METLTQKLRYFDYERLHPLRSTRWRYDRVMEMVDARKKHQKEPEPGRDDRYVRRARKFLMEWKRRGQGQDEDQIDRMRQKLFPKYPGLFYAYEIFTGPEDSIRWMLESRLLAGQTDEEIAKNVGFIPEMIEWYEALFFNVRDRLENKDYIVSQVIRPSMGTGLQNLTMEMSAKFFGYFGGVKK